MTEREACIIFNMISGIGHAKYRALCEYFGSGAAALEQPEEALREVPGIGPQLAGRVADFRREIDWQEEMEFAERGGVRILTLADEAYPGILRELYDPPLVLYVRGVLPEFGCGQALAVVGSRRMSRYGAETTAMLTADAVAAGMVIISGLAFGVDTVAHSTTVERGGVTVAVLGGGLARLHPQENLPLARRIIETGGALISEFPMRFPVNRTSFPRRNRIVARLADAVLVTEAGLDSGAMITANLALEAGVQVLAVPGRIDNPQSRGCHKLLRDGAVLVEQIGDILEAMGSGLLPFSRQLGEPEIAYAPRSTSDLPEDAARVLEILRAGECTFDELAVRTGLDSGNLGGILLRLEMQLLVRHSADQVYSLRA